MKSTDDIEVLLYGTLSKSTASIICPFCEQKTDEIGLGILLGVSHAATVRRIIDRHRPSCQALRDPIFQISDWDDDYYVVAEDTEGDLWMVGSIPTTYGGESALILSPTTVNDVFDDLRRRRSTTKTQAKALDAAMDKMREYLGEKNGEEK